MKSFSNGRTWLALSAAIAVIAGGMFAAVSHNPQSAVAEGVSIFLDWSDGPGNCNSLIPIPPNCATWHEVSPVFCTNYHQDFYEDNGDGYVSPCDYIVLNGIRYHVDSAGPTLYLDCSGSGGESNLILEAVSTFTGDPTTTQWTEVYPSPGTAYGYCEAWQDNGDGVMSVCDFVTIGGTTCHIKRIGCDIRVSVPPNATETTTWGKVKNFLNF